LLESKALFVKTLFHWAAALDSNITNFHIFLDFFVLLFRCLYYILLRYLGCALHFSIKLRLLIEKGIFALQTNTSVATSLGTHFLSQISLIFLDMLNVYRYCSLHISYVSSVAFLLD
jgi:hypothetical protein